MNKPIQELLDSFDHVKLSAPNKQKVAMFQQKFKSLAEEIAAAVTGREVTVALRKLREAKHCLVLAITAEQKEKMRIAKEALGE